FRSLGSQRLPSCRCRRPDGAGQRDLGGLGPRPPRAMVLAASALAGLAAAADRYGVTRLSSTTIVSTMASGSYIQRVSSPAITAPMIGASQNSQSCRIYSPPPNSAGPVLRAGLTEVLVTGIDTRWIKVS